MRKLYAEADSATRARMAPKMKKKRVVSKQGRPLSNEGMLRWSDVTTPRWPSLVENVFGEPLLFHRRHLLGDALRHRPVFVEYDIKANYFVEAAVVLLFLAGIACGIRSRLLWLALSWFGFDMALHLGLGFGINEVYIMSPHWLFVLPVAMAFTLPPGARLAAGSPARRGGVPRGLRAGAQRVAPLPLHAHARGLRLSGSGPARASSSRGWPRPGL